jgi:hypothetical protein
MHHRDHREHRGKRDNGGKARNSRRKPDVSFFSEFSVVLGPYNEQRKGRR